MANTTQARKRIRRNQMQPELARGVAKGVVHKNTAARKFSRLTKRLSSLG